MEAWSKISHNVPVFVCVFDREIQEHQVEMEREESQELRDLPEILVQQEHLAYL